LSIARTSIVFVFGLLLAGCAYRAEDFGRQPQMSPVGAGVPATLASSAVAGPPAVRRPVWDTSAWHDSAADLFRDARAMRVGDVITVKISIKDKAVIDNSTNRSRESTTNLDQSLKYGAAIGGLNRSGDASVQGGGSAKTEATGKGGVTRSESIDLVIAAVVTEVLPNGNLVIRGTQEVRVNFEVRELTVGGIVRPRDVATDNSVSYERIAEARISYGGRGRITEVQQPAWGQQLIDAIAPF
jgi:flagellar L-ring protein FlgH